MVTFTPTFKDLSGTMTEIIEKLLFHIHPSNPTCSHFIFQLGHLPTVETPGYANASLSSVTYLQRISKCKADSFKI